VSKNELGIQEIEYPKIEAYKKDLGGTSEGPWRISERIVENCQFKTVIFIRFIFLREI
jgi:hypothetical protein